MTIFPTSRKWLFTLLLLVMGCLGAFGAIEDYTTYTEVDTSGYLTVTDSNTLDLNVTGTTEYYLYKDFGAGYFDGDLWFRVQAKCSDVTTNGFYVFFHLSDITDPPYYSYANDIEGLMLLQGGIDGTPDQQNYQIVDTLDTSIASSGNKAIDTVHYLDIYRRGRIWWHVLYSDADRTAYAGIAYTVCTPEQDYRYFHVIGNYASAFRGTMQVENHEIVENNPSAPAGSEDYTTYTESDEGTRVFVEDANTISFVGSVSNEDNYVYKDAGADHFNGDFTHELEISQITASGNASDPCFWGVTNTVDDALNWAAGLRLYFSSNGVVPASVLTLDAKTSSVSDTGNYNRGTPYYVTIVRDVTAKTLVCTYYTDRAKTSLVDTLSINLATNDVDLEDYRYVYASSSMDGASTNNANWVVGNLELNESTPTPTPTAADTATPTATDTPTITQTPSDTPTITNTPSDTPTITNTPSDTPTVTDTPTITNTPSDTPTITNTPSDTPTVTDTPTITNTPSDTPTVTNTPSDTPTITNTPSDTPTITNTPSNTATDTPTETHTPTNTSTPTVTNTPSHTPTTRPGGLDKTIGRGIGQGIGRGIR